MRRALQRGLGTNPHRYPSYDKFGKAQGKCKFYLVVAWSSIITTLVFGVILWRVKVKITPPPGPTEDQRKSRIVEVSEEQLKQLAAGRNGNS